MFLGGLSGVCRVFGTTVLSVVVAIALLFMSTVVVDVFAVFLWLQLVGFAVGASGNAGCVAAVAVGVAARVY